MAIWDGVIGWVAFAGVLLAVVVVAVAFLYIYERISGWIDRPLVLLESTRAGRFRYTMGDLFCFLLQIQVLFSALTGVFAAPDFKTVWPVALIILIAISTLVFVIWRRGVSRLNSLGVADRRRRWALLLVVQPIKEVGLGLSFLAQLCLVVAGTLVAIFGSIELSVIGLICLVYLLSFATVCFVCRLTSSWIARGVTVDPIISPTIKQT